MQREKIYLERIKRWIEENYPRRYFGKAALKAAYIVDEKPISYQQAISAQYQEIKPGEVWARPWNCGWFRFQGEVPAEFAGQQVGALIDVEGEACIWREGSPDLGLTNKIHWNLWSGKYFVPLFEKAEAGKKIELLAEASANELFGAGSRDYHLIQAEIVCLDRPLRQLIIDFRTLLSLTEALEKRSPRRQKILRGLNDAINLYQNGAGQAAALDITKKLLAAPATASALTAYSIGHAHLDLAWLWPIRETRRKAGRTFATVLKYMEEYPDYKFGASQPQLYQWVKEDYPKLYAKIKQAVAAERWECQGAMWVEPDMNLTGGEALVRQCFYGKKFFRDEFGKEIDHLWLPDVFGYSAALPQILKKCGVDYFMTQKISWNETNKFPHHTFMWQGIDGTEILTHFLPTNDYNLSNWPTQLVESEQRYAQNDLSEEFLNLYGIGDGGGGPSRLQIELGLRQQNLEGSPKFKFAFAQDFFAKIGQIPRERLPQWRGELYLELHRGTYTTQALIKKNNRLLELRLRDLEFLGTLVENYPKAQIEQVWKDTLLNQFHDILPGSSINWVYKDANALSAQNLDKLADLTAAIFDQLHGKTDKRENYIIYNSLSWERQEILQLPAENGELIETKLQVPALGYTTVNLAEIAAAQGQIRADEKSLENALIKISLAKDGTISSIFDKEAQREVLAGSANQLLLWEDQPNNWGAWDVNHFYRETTPQPAKLLESKLIYHSALQASIWQKFTIGNSTIEQTLTLCDDSKFIKIETQVDWREEHKMLRVEAAAAIYSQQASYEIQYGTLQRPTHANTSWDAAKFEVVAQRFADLSQPDYGLALINDCKYGHYIQGNVLSLNLLRSPKDTDKEADLHQHQFTFGYFPHLGELTQSDTLKTAHELNSPLICTPIAKIPLPASKSWWSLTDSQVKIETIKPAEDGEGIILRLYETKGANCQTRLQAAEPWQQLLETDMLENKLQVICQNQQEQALQFKPFEIRTFRLV
ncbi:MAG: glycoside hydrolase family 38 C-terminal domain-containing protein [Candidatus Cloacimonadales bacterium]